MNKKLISALAGAGLLVVASSAFAADTKVDCKVNMKGTETWCTTADGKNWMIKENAMQKELMTKDGQMVSFWGMIDTTNNTVTISKMETAAATTGTPTH